MQSTTSQSNQLIFIKSYARVQSDPDLYIFKNPLRANNGNRIMCELMEAQIPLSYYTFSHSFNLLSFNIESFDTTSQSTNTTTTIDYSFLDKKYNINDVISELNSAFTSDPLFNITFHMMRGHIKLL